MTRAVPCKLPACFRWTEEPDRRRLFIEDVQVLEVCPQRRGWIVRVHLQDEAEQQPDVAVPSIDAGMRWGARWSRLRASRLASRAAQGHPPGRPGPQGQS